MAPQDDLTAERAARTAVEIVKQFDYRSDCDMSFADRQWLIANIKQALLDRLASEGG